MKFESFYDIDNIVYFINTKDKKIQKAKIKMIIPYAIADSTIFGGINFGINYSISLEDGTLLDSIEERFLLSDKYQAESLLAFWIHKKLV